jgi:hypothetical protein
VQMRPGALIVNGSEGIVMLATCAERKVKHIWNYQLSALLA